MKLKEFVEDVYKIFDLSPDNDIITGDKLKFLLPTIRYLDEFSGCILNVYDGKNTCLEERMWENSDDNIGGKFEIHSIRLSAAMWNPNNAIPNIKGGCGISPILYDIESCAPYKEIKMRIEPFKYVDYRDYIKEAHEKLDDILRRNILYQASPIRYVMVRGNFKEVKYLKLKL